MIYFFSEFLVSAYQRDDPYPCPLSARDVSGLPPVMLVIPELDVLAEQSFVLEARLRSWLSSLARGLSRRDSQLSRSDVGRPSRLEGNPKRRVLDPHSFDLTTTKRQ
jgi:hypothetical protein